MSHEIRVRATRQYAASGSGVVAISNSYGAGEFSGESSYASYYNVPSGKVMWQSCDHTVGLCGFGP